MYTHLSLCFSLSLSVVNVGDIKEIRAFTPSEKTIKKATKKWSIQYGGENQCFAIVVGRHLMEVNFIYVLAQHPVVCDQWVVGLRAIRCVRLGVCMRVCVGEERRSGCKCRFI